MLFQEGAKPAIDLAREATVARDEAASNSVDIKIARRETAENTACDAAVAADLTAALGTLSDLVSNASTSAAATAERQAEMVAMLAQMVNLTATAVGGGSTSNSNDADNDDAAAAAELSMRAMGPLPSCMAYHVANPNLKSGVYVLAKTSM